MVGASERHNNERRRDHRHDRHYNRHIQAQAHAPKGIYQALAVANDNGVSGSGATNFTVQ